MQCAICEYCRYPRTADDNNGSCKCIIMKNKTIDVYVSGGETPSWCPRKDEKEQDIKVSKAIIRKKVTDTKNQSVLENLQKYKAILETKGNLNVAYNMEYALDRINEAIQEIQRLQEQNRKIRNEVIDEFSHVLGAKSCFLKHIEDDYYGWVSEREIEEEAQKLKERYGRE